MCQCPEWGDLHFYLESFPVMKALLMSVNALNGATSISTISDQIRICAQHVCVNALKGATSISTELNSNGKNGCKKCVNALKGATSISTQ